jgi:tetratricopeptide (TPR) repeat protein
MNRFTSLLLLLLGLAVTILWLPAQTIIQIPIQADSLRRVIATAKHDTTRVSAMNELAYYLCEKKSQYDSATAQARAALEVAERIGFRMGVAAALQNIGVVLYRRGKYAEALGYFFKSLKLKEELADRGGMSKSLNTIALVYYTQGKNAEALENYFKSLRIREEIGDKSGIAMSLNNIANVYGDQGKNTEALEYFFKSLRIQEEIGDKSGIALSLNNIAIVYSDQGKNAEALENFFKSLRIQEEIGDKSGIANSLNNIGNTYKIMGQFKQAQSYLFRSLQLWKDIGRIGELSMTLNNLAISYRGQSKFDSAMVFSLRSLVLADSIGVKLRVKEALEELSIIMDSLGRHKESLAYFKRSTTVKDSLVNLESLNKTSQLKELYDVEKREQQIALQQSVIHRNTIIQGILLGVLLVSVIIALWFRSLYRQKNQASEEILRQQHTLENQAVEIELANSILNERNIALEALDQEKNEFLGIAAHDLKNPLSSIRLTADRLMRYGSRLSMDEQHVYLQKILDVIERMMAIITNLLDINTLERGAMPFTITSFDSPPSYNLLCSNTFLMLNQSTLRSTSAMKLWRSQYSPTNKQRCKFWTILFPTP